MGTTVVLIWNKINQTKEQPTSLRIQLFMNLQVILFRYLLCFMYIP